MNQQHTVLIAINGYELDPEYFFEKGHHDSTLQLIQEHLKAGHRVLVATSRDDAATFSGELGTPLSVQEITLAGISLVEGESIVHAGKALNLTVTSDTVQIAHIRTDPPNNDDAYEAVLSHADEWEKMGIVMVNPPSVIRDMHEKLSVCNDTFLEEHPDLVSKTLHTAEADEILQLYKDNRQQGLILKPVDGFGGMGVEQILPKMSDNNAIIAIYKYLRERTNGERILAQPCIPEVDKNGDVRSLVTRDETGAIVVGSTRRVPLQGGVVANMAAGGAGLPVKPTTHEHAALYNAAAVASGRTVEDLKFTEEQLTAYDRAVGKMKVLFQEQEQQYPGFTLVGYDLLYDSTIGDFRLGECNNTSPTCMFEAEKGDGVNIAAAVVGYTDRQATEKTMIQEMKAGLCMA